ncbi:MAG: hypothetical protein ACRDAQ_05450 [Cetobacterium sp.]
MRITDSGIDTIQVELNGIIEVEKIDNKAMLKDKTKYTANGNTKIVMMLSLYFDKKRKLSTVKEVDEVLKMNKEINKINSLDRLDIAIDFLEEIQDKKNLFRIILECYARQKKFKTDVFKTVKGIAETGNLKLSNNRLELTAYSCKDKIERIGNTRLEIHNKDLRITDINKNSIVDKINTFICDLKNMLQFQEQVEREYIEQLTLKFKETKGNNFINFSEFIAWADYEGYILTSNILKGLLKSCGIKTGYKNFYDKFKSKRKETLKFTTEKELKDTIKMVEKELKKCIKN